MSISDDDLFGPDPADESSERASEVLRALATFGEALSLDEAQSLAGSRGITLALFMGEISTGKSTLLVEMWTDFMLSGALGDYRLAGSSSAVAFEKRAYLSRNQADVEVPDTERTRAADEGWLHMRVARPDGSKVELLLSDFAGERFKRVREGTDLQDEFPFVSRVDQFFVVVDGDGFASPVERENTFNRARRLLQALARSEALHATSRVCVLLTKSDRFTEEVIDLYRAREAQLLRLARQIDPDAVALRLAARPAEEPEPVALDALLAQLCRRPRQFVADDVGEPIDSRRSMDGFMR